MTWKIKNKLREIAEAEEGIHIKDPGGKINMCLVFPNTYYLGMSNLGFTSIYSFLNDHDDVFCERAFFPDSSLSPAVPDIPIFTVETRRRLNDFDLIGFSVSFENDYLNILKILGKTNIPLLRSDRDAQSPIIFCGGFAPSLNPEILAEICDVIILGDGEPPMEEMLDLLRKEHLTREKFLEGVARIEGMYVPSLYAPEYDREGTFLGFQEGMQKIGMSVADLNRYPAHTTIFTEKTEFGDMFLVEIARGCVKKCLFCGVSHRPGGFRCLDKELLKNLIRRGLQSRGRIGLVGSAVLDHPYFEEIAGYTLSEGGKISPASIRAEMVTKEIADLLGKSDLKTAALAPETGDEIRRRTVGKGIGNDTFFEAAELLYRSGISNIKLYFIAGLPGTLEEEDVHHTVQFVKKLSHHVKVSQKKTSGPRIIVSMAGFVPKGRTPFQFSAFPGIERLQSTYKHLRQALMRERNIKFESDVPKYSYLQTLLSAGDRRVSKMLARWDTEKDVLKHFKHSSVNPDYFVMREKKGDEILPWDDVFKDYGKSRLWEIYRRFRSP